MCNKRTLQKEKAKTPAEISQCLENISAICPYNLQIVYCYYYQCVLSTCVDKLYFIFDRYQSSLLKLEGK